MSNQLILTDTDDPAIEEAIATLLIEYNDSRSGPGNAKALVIAIREASGLVAGGLTGHTARKWLFTELLFVPEALRGQGLGTRMMKGKRGRGRYFSQPVGA